MIASFRARRRGVKRRLPLLCQVSRPPTQSYHDSLRLRTFRDFPYLYRAEVVVGVLARALQRADASLDTVRVRVETGLLPPNDVLSAQAQRARQNVQLIHARVRV